MRYALTRGMSCTWATVVRPSLELEADTPLVVQPDAADRFVSRGGLKLAGALVETGLDVRGWVCLDVGQSTGGFTDCLLQAGAARVVGVDVGHGQLHPRLRGDARVVCIEGLNARHLHREALGQSMPSAGFDLAVVDASFISLKLLLPPLPALMRPGGMLLALIKPQFEVGPAGLGKGGVVRDARRHAQAIADVLSVARQCGLVDRGVFPSPIGGSDGNQEYFLWASLPFEAMAHAPTPDPGD